MSLPRNVLLALCIVLLGAIVPGGADAQQDKPIDLKPLLPPILPPLLPPTSEVTSGVVGGTPIPGGPYSSTTPTQSPSAPAPGMRLSIPTK